MCIRDSLGTATDASGITYNQGGTGASSRTVENKLQETLSVKDFGAVGDGVTDDTVAIQAAIDSLAGGGTLLFPRGTYVSNTQINFTLTGAIALIGDDATIKCTSSTFLSYQLLLTIATYDLQMKGLTFDANQKARTCFRGNAQSQDSSTLTMKDCTFKNAYTDTTTGSTGVYLSGGYNKVLVDNSTFKDITRAAGSGTPGSQGTGGLGISEHYLTNEFPRFISVQNCRFENLTNNETTASANNYDVDGLSIGGGNASGANYISSSAIISNNTFRNCKGRCIKSQNDQTVVTNNSFYRNMTTIVSSTEVNLQVGSGTVSGNVFHYDEVSSGVSPFTFDGSSGAGLTLISFYNGTADTRNNIINCSDNIVYNNVPITTGYLAVFCNFNGYSAPFYRINVTNNSVSKKVDNFISMTPTVSPNFLYLNASNNYAEAIETTFMSGNGGGAVANNIITATGNVNAGTEVPFSWYPSGSQEVTAHYSIINCTGMTPVANLISNSGQSFPSGISTLGATARSGGLVQVHSVSIADDATYQFPEVGYASQFTFRVLSVNYNSVTTGIFTDTNTTVTDYGGGLSTGIAYGATNPDTDTKVNVYRNGSNLEIKNRLGSSRVFTLISMG
jgi:polygalacturonase